ncbi:hypothetical protein LZQ00_00695 [Sphingobacterium sp. SRCM116780]|uniref:hypothetical protein n=1 Tax=Sphingobacterium sp. SRCM116780 TaxID=2907623 RepID=UPI001F1DF00C|nr:hypothetical protein [Sphingobacterium sp. SRCM116780]UIR56360.1 hypothetical protein LZQ00_00695 [Sphingobacterium sp. SRCM116780]
MSTTNTITNRYYPALSEVITVDDLPEFLHSAEEGLNGLLDRIHYKNLQYSRSQRGDSAYYSLDVVAKNIGLALPFSMRLVLNPDEDGDSSISSFPVSLQYQWEMLAYLRAFKTQKFAFTPEAFFDLGLQIFKISEGETAAHIINNFIESEEGIDDKFQQLVDAINLAYPSANLAFPAGEEPTANKLVELINANVQINKTVSAVLFAIYIGSDVSDAKDKLQQFYQQIIPSGIEEYIRSLIVPKVRATVTLSAGIEFPKNILKPVDAQGKELPDPDRKALFKFAEATFYADTEAGIGSEIELAGSLLPGPCMIGNTGFIVEFEKAKLDVSKQRNIPEADLAGYGPDFTGLYIKHAGIKYLGFGETDGNTNSLAIVGDDLFIGTGGLSGRIALESEGVLKRKFGNFTVELDRFAVDFNKGKVSHSDIAGTLTIERFKKDTGTFVIDIDAQIEDDGNFMVTAQPQSEPLKITLENILEIKIRSLQLGKEDRGFYVEVAGSLDFLADIPGLGKVLPKNIEVQRFRIWEDGDLEFEGGSFIIPQAITLKVGPVNMEIKEICLGSYTKMHNGVERRYRYFGFDGMINTGRAGVKATGDGIKYYFTVDDNDTDKPFDNFTSIDGIGIDLTIPGNVSKEQAAFILNGYLSMSNPDPTIVGSNAGVEYTGAVTFALPKLKLAGSAKMRLNPKVPAFIVDIGLELPTPIPLGPTGLGIYGFRGLIGQHYMPSKKATTPPLSEDATWWDYYKAKSKITGLEGIEIDKFANEPGFSVGAGASIATTFDGGYTFSSKLFLMLGLPDVFLLQGQAAILRERIGITSDVDPPFSAMISIDNKSVMASLGVNYLLPEKGAAAGDILTVQGKMELAFFFNNASGWYINLGKDQPESERVRARILSLFEGYSYMMLSAKGFKVGAGAKFDFKKKFGPVSVGLGAYIDLSGSISFKPIQFGAQAQFGGYAYLKVFFVKLGLSVNVILGIDAPNPFRIYGSLEVKLNLPWPIKDIKFKLAVEWTFNKNTTALNEPIEVLKLPNEAEGYMPAAAINILSEESFPINYLNKAIPGTMVNIPAPGSTGWRHNFNTEEEAKLVTIPLDSYIDIDLMSPVKPYGADRLGGAMNQLPDGYLQMVPPEKGLSEQVPHELRMMGLDIFCWADNQWKPYHVYDAVTAIVEANQGQVDLHTLKDGYWQFDEPNKYKKIRLLSQNMFAMTKDETSAVVDMDALNFKRKDLFCFEDAIKKYQVDWKYTPEGIIYSKGRVFEREGFKFTLNGISAVVVSDITTIHNNFRLRENGGSLEILLPEPLTYFQLRLAKSENTGTVAFYTHREVPTQFGHTEVEAILIQTADIQVTEEQQELAYENLQQPIHKVVVQLAPKRVLGFEGNLQIGGYQRLPESAGLTAPHAYEAKKTLADVVLFNRALAAQELLTPDLETLSGAVGNWNGFDRLDHVGTNDAIIMNTPILLDTLWLKAAQNELMELSKNHTYIANADSLQVMASPSLKVEEGDFSIALTMMFSALETGVSTLLSKVYVHPENGDKKGFSVHLVRRERMVANHDYRNDQVLPGYDVVFTSYNDQTASSITAHADMLMDCSNGFIPTSQYAQIAVTVSRASNTIHIYVDKVLKASAPIPSQLNLDPPRDYATDIFEMIYMTESVHRRVEESEMTREGFIEENEKINANLNQTIQPVWRPDTIYAVVVKTKDVVNKNEAGAVQQNFIYGFKTAGPVGHFHEQSAVYQQLASQDQAASFKLASLKHYIDYERSFPDALGRQDRSKPLFYDEAKVGLLFTKPYLNAMYGNWDGYQGRPAVQSRLDMKLIDPYGAAFSPELVWEELPEESIDDSNFRSLPADQQRIYLLNRSAFEDACNPSDIVITKKKKKGEYRFPTLLPNRLYTALFESIYQPEGQAEKKAEVHRFGIMTSRYANFNEQVNSQHAIYPIVVEMDTQQLEGLLLDIWNNTYAGNDANILRYTDPYERMIYGGLQLQNLQSYDHTVVQPIIQVDPITKNRKIIAVLVRNPEPFNHPNLPKETLVDTIQLGSLNASLEFQADTAIQAIHSTNLSSVLLSNAQLSIAAGYHHLSFKYKQFNGQDYQTDVDAVILPMHLSTDGTA